MKIQCACGHWVDIEGAKEHSRTCNQKREPLMLPYSAPPAPKPINGCTCDFCVGLTICPICKLKTLYVDRKAGYWKCVKCNHYFHIDNIKHANNIPVIDNKDQDLGQQKNAQDRLQFWKENLNDR
jgi:hypothetical protein